MMGLYQVENPMNRSLTALGQAGNNYARMQPEIEPPDKTVGGAMQNAAGGALAAGGVQSYAKAAGLGAAGTAATTGATTAAATGTGLMSAGSPVAVDMALGGAAAEGGGMLGMSALAGPAGLAVGAGLAALAYFLS